MSSGGSGGGGVIIIGGGGGGHAKASPIARSDLQMLIDNCPDDDLKATLQGVADAYDAS